jgi:uncharacterized membrane protein YeaQ/YmgE (transglycosylase-associated protein family)
MEVVGFLIALVVTGTIVGALGRLALPGPDPMTIGQTILVGVGGSVLAGVAVNVLTGGEEGAGMLASVLGATLIVYLVRRSRRTKAGPGGR